VNRCELLVVLLAFLASCSRDYSALSPFPCASDHTCPGGLACDVDAGCIPAHADSLCVSGGSHATTGAGDEATDCTANLANGTCFGGTCESDCSEAPCTDPARTCVTSGMGDACLLTCTTSPKCPAGTSCIAYSKDTKVCAPPELMLDQCVSVDTNSQCNSFQCGQSAFTIDCGSGRTCPSHGICVSGGGCNCEYGYAPRDCSGQPCNGSCQAPNYGCMPVWLGACDSPGGYVDATCTCRDGHTVHQSCSEMRPCSQLCAQ
jgi:hypothetical protein